MPKHPITKTSLDATRLERVPLARVSPSTAYLLGFDVADGGIAVYCRPGGARYFSVTRSGLVRRAQRTVPALVCSSPKDAFALFNDLRGGRPLNFTERLLGERFSRRWRGETSDGQIARYLPLLRLGTASLGHLASGRLSPDTALALCRLTSADRRSFIDTVVQFRLTAGQQRELLEHVQDAVRLMGSSFRSVIDNLRRNISEKDQRAGDRLAETARRERMPDFTAALDRFEAARKKLGLPEKTHVVPPPFFETKTLKIELFARSRAELESRLGALVETVGKKKDTWDDLFSIP